jgi:hypothetical protein
VTKQIYLHVGLHKTGTSFLQARVFPNLPGVRFVHPLHRLREDPGPIESFFFELFFRNAACIDMDAHRAAIDAWFETVDEDKVLISSEAIVGWPTENHSNLRVNVEVLAEMFPRAKVLFLVRRQDTWAESAYRQILRAGFSTTIERYLNYADGAFDRYNMGLYNGPNLDARDLNWEAFDRLFRRRFPEGVLTLPYEYYRREQGDFLAELTEWMELPAWELPEGEETVNEAWSPAALRVAKLVNRIPMPIKLAVRDRIGSEMHPSEVISRVGSRLGLNAKADAKMSETMREQLMALHAESNARLCERIGGRLRAYGYHAVEPPGSKP